MVDNQNLQLSIIVPVYGVEKYIRPCIESLFRQGLDENCFEVIIVNDGTKDRSMEMIQDIIEQHKNIIVLNQENLSLSVARNNGISMAKGKYILMPDSDDLLIENSLKPLLEKALEYEVDLVVADFLKMSNEEIDNLQNIPQKDFCIQEKTGEQLFIEDLNPHECFVWRTLYRRSFLQNEGIKFYPGIRYQDVPFTHECYLKAKKCFKISWLLNIYRKWPGASTSIFNLKKAKDFSIAIALTWELTRYKKENSAISFKLREDVWISFLMLILSICHSLSKKSERIEAIDFLKSRAPDLCFQNGKKQRFYTFMYKNLPHTLIRIRYLYGISFENVFIPFFNHHLRKQFIGK